MKSSNKIPSDLEFDNLEVFLGKKIKSKDIIKALIGTKNIKKNKGEIISNILIFLKNNDKGVK